MKRMQKWWIAAAAGLALVAMAGIAATSAQTGTSTPVTGTTFLQRLAGKLGLPVDTVRQAARDASTDEIDARVASGDLTQEQADAMKQQLATAPDDQLLDGGHGGRHGGRHGGHGPGFGVGDPDALASFLGITADQLHTELEADGATLATVAAAHGKSRDDLKAYLTSQAKTHLDAEVAAGTLTQAEADQRLADKTANLDAVIDRSGGPRGDHGEGFGPPPGDDGSTPQPSLTPGA